MSTSPFPTTSLPWKQYDYAVIDLEGTGAQHREHEGIVDICVIPIDRGVIGEPSFRALLDPQIEIPPAVSRIHGIKDADVVGRPTLADVTESILRAVDGRFLIAHNAPVERRVLSHRLPQIYSTEMLDTLKLAKYAVPSLTSFGLDNLIKFFDMEHFVNRLSSSFGRHSAIFDAKVTAIIFEMLLAEYFPNDCLLGDLLRISGDNVPPGQSALFG
jgi:DNA polymerase III epsilon subunit-like protein